MASLAEVAALWELDRGEQEQWLQESDRAKLPIRADSQPGTQKFGRPKLPILADSQPGTKKLDQVKLPIRADSPLGLGPRKIAACGSAFSSTASREQLAVERYSAAVSGHLGLPAPP